MINVDSVQKECQTKVKPLYADSTWLVTAWEGR